jgi:hypothetical protein
MPRDEGGQVWTYFDYTHAMVRRMCGLTALPILVMVQADVNRYRRATLAALCGNVRVVEVPTVAIESRRPDYSDDRAAKSESESSLNSDAESLRWRQTGSKLAPFNMTEYQTIMVLDSDTFMLHNADAAFCDYHQSLQRNVEPKPTTATTTTEAATGVRRTYVYAPPIYAAVTLDASRDLYSSVFLLRPDRTTYAALLASLQRAIEGQENDDADGGRKRAVVRLRQRQRQRQRRLESHEHLSDQDIMRERFIGPPHPAPSSSSSSSSSSSRGGAGATAITTTTTTATTTTTTTTIGRMTCLEPQFNCRIHHRAQALCYGLALEGDVWASVAIVHAKLGECNLGRLLPRARELWLRNLPPGRSHEGQAMGRRCS